MRPAGFRTTARFHAVRTLRRIEILVSPLLGVITTCLGYLVGWILLAAIALLWVLMLPLVLVVLRMGTRARRNLITETDVDLIIRTGHLNTLTHHPKR